MTKSCKASRNRQPCLLLSLLLLGIGRIRVCLAQGILCGLHELPESRVECQRLGQPYLPGRSKPPHQTYDCTDVTRSSYDTRATLHRSCGTKDVHQDSPPSFSKLRPQQAYAHCVKIAGHVPCLVSDGIFGVFYKRSRNAFCICQHYTKNPTTNVLTCMSKLLACIPSDETYYCKHKTCAPAIPSYVHNMR